MAAKKSRSYNRNVRATAVPPPGDRTITGSKNPNGLAGSRMNTKKITFVNSARTGQWKTAETWAAMRYKHDRVARRS